MVCNFSWDMKMSQEESKTMPMQISLGVKEVYYGIVEVENRPQTYFPRTKIISAKSPIPKGFYL